MGKRSADWPSGTVTFLFTDLEGSTALWEDDAAAMREAVARHDVLLERCVEANGGHVVKTIGDGLVAVFVHASGAVAAALACQQALAAEAFPVGIRARMGLYTGEAEPVDGDYHAPVLNRAARVMSAGHGGQVLLSAATATLVRDDFDLIDLGEHRLRDLGTPEPLSQLTHPDLGREFAPLRTLDELPGNLPAQVTSFVGRHAEVASLSHVLASARMVTLTGVGGVGKTRLALQTAAELVPRFRGGAWLCALAAAVDRESMLEAIADTLTIRQREAMTMADSIVEYLRDRELLIVLDNCEHLLADASWLADRVLQRCPSVTILATSREGLGVPGERIVAVPSLPLPDDSAPPGSGMPSPAVQLFADRAVAVRADFVLDGSSSGPVGEVCRRLDGIPLAIELAAVRVTALTPAEIAAHLDERFRLLRGGRGTRVDRHQTLLATVEWSYSLLDDADRQVFDRLGVFVGSFTVDAAQSVAADEEIDEWDVLDALANLVDKSMVVAEPTAEGTTRYRLLETLRVFALDRLDAAGATDPVRRRHAHHYARLCHELGPHLFGPDERVFHAKFERELDNIWAMYRWGVDAPTQADADVAIEALASTHPNFSAIEERWRAGSWANAMVERARTSPSPLRARIFGAAAAWNAVRRGEFGRAESLALEGLADPCVDEYTAITSYSALQVIRYEQARFTEALEICHEYFANWGAIVYAAGVHTMASQSHLALGDLDAAQREAEAGLAKAEKSGSDDILALSLMQVGLVWATADPDRALAAFERAIAISDYQSDLVLGGAAQLRVRRGDIAQAFGMLRRALVQIHDRGQRTGLGLTLYRTLDVCEVAGQDELAAVCAGILESETVMIASQFTRLPRVAARVAERLGPDPYATAQDRGAALPLDRVAPTVIAAIDEILATTAPVLPRLGD